VGQVSLAGFKITYVSDPIFDPEDLSKLFGLEEEVQEFQPTFKNRLQHMTLNRNILPLEKSLSKRDFADAY
jgi:hypothetical protein